MNPTQPLIIMVAPNGSHATKQHNPAVPYSVVETVDEIVRAAEAGAAIAHIHARTSMGQSTQDVEVFRKIVDGVRERSDILLELSLGSGGFSVAEAIAPLELSPPMASFPMAVRNEAGDQISAMENIVRHMTERGVHPCFGVNSLDSNTLISGLIRRGLAGAIPCVTVSADPFETAGEAEKHLRERIEGFPPNTQWFAIKGGKSGRNQLILRTLAIGMGGNVRVGFEDTVFTYDNDKPAPSNAWFVERMVEIAKDVGRPIATPAEARRILQLT
jgi:3-keto-5-aminohexanoate cleavage enzyme